MEFGSISNHYAWLGEWQQKFGNWFPWLKKVPELASTICSQLCLLFQVAASLELLQLNGRILKNWPSNLP